MTSITVWNNPRPTKQLLVLDIDLTLAQFSYPINSQNIANTRKHLNYFLMEAYKNYDIAIWSGTSMKIILKKLTCMNMLKNAKFKLVFALDITFMTHVNSLIYGKILVKPLSVIWDTFQQYSEKNTIIIDDQRKNFYHNPKNGLEILPYFSKNHETDEELFTLSMYLENLATQSTDFTDEDLRNWKCYV